MKDGRTIGGYKRRNGAPESDIFPPMDFFVPVPKDTGTSTTSSPNPTKHPAVGFFESIFRDAGVSATAEIKHEPFEQALWLIDIGAADRSELLIAEIPVLGPIGVRHQIGPANKVFLVHEAIDSALGTNSKDSGTPLQFALESNGKIHLAIDLSVLTPSNLAKMESKRHTLVRILGSPTIETQPIRDEEVNGRVRPPAPQPSPPKQG